MSDLHYPMFDMHQLNYLYQLHIHILIPIPGRRRLCWHMSVRLLWWPLDQKMCPLPSPVCHLQFAHHLQILYQQWSRINLVPILRFLCSLLSNKIDCIRVLLFTMWKLVRWLFLNRVKFYNKNGHNFFTPLLYGL